MAVGVKVDADDVLQLLRDFILEKENLRIADVAPDKKKKVPLPRLRAEPVVYGALHQEQPSQAEAGREPRTQRTR